MAGSLVARGLAVVFVGLAAWLGYSIWTSTSDDFHLLLAGLFVGLPALGVALGLLFVAVIAVLHVTRVDRAYQWSLGAARAWFASHNVRPWVWGAAAATTAFWVGTQYPFMTRQDFRSLGQLGLFAGLLVGTVFAGFWILTRVGRRKGRIANVLSCIGILLVVVGPLVVIYGLLPTLH